MGRCPKCRAWMKPARDSDAMTDEGLPRCPRCHAKLRLAAPRKGMAAAGLMIGGHLAVVAWLVGLPAAALPVLVLTTAGAAFIEIWDLVP